MMYIIYHIYNYSFNVIYKYISHLDVISLTLNSDETKLFIGHISGKIDCLENIIK